MNLFTIRLAFVISMACVVASCAPASSEPLGTSRWGSSETLEFRLLRLALPLSVAAVDWCPHRRDWSYGFILTSGEDSGSGKGSPGRGVRVKFVHPQLPSGQVGMKEGDHIVRVNGESVTDLTSENVNEQIGQATRARIQPLTLEVDSGGTRRTFNLTARPTCPFRIEWIDDEQVNAFSNGREVLITSGMLDFLRSDDEVAWVLAHELAHHVLDHSGAARLELALHGLLAATTEIAHQGSELSRVEREAQADYVASYTVALAGFDLQEARGFLARLSAVTREQPEAVFLVTHPAPPERLAAFDRTMREIEGKRQRGEALSLTAPVLVMP